jgi:hypothetical protein
MAIAITLFHSGGLRRSLIPTLAEILPISHGGNDTFDYTSIVTSLQFYTVTVVHEHHVLIEHIKNNLSKINTLERKS